MADRSGKTTSKSEIRLVNEFLILRIQDGVMKKRSPTSMYTIMYVGHGKRSWPIQISVLVQIFNQYYQSL